ncbi:MAG: LytR C-terminal domain-containing protein, partial [Solirubrobacteraceae bacterium]
GAVPARPPGAPVGAGGPKYFKPERSPARMTALIVGGVIVAVLVVVGAVLGLKGGGSSPSSKVGSTSSARTQPAASHAVASNPADVPVTVLNGTETNGLAHHLAGDLQQSGYSQAAASTAVPPGTHATTVVEYTAGHRADGQAVAKALEVTRVQTIEGTIASLASSATVVVIAGADQAALLGGSGAQSKGEPAASEGGTGEAAGGNSAGSGESGESGAGESAAGNGN